jgi:hypothetical protein
MEAANGTALENLIANLAVDSINTQLRFNEAHEIALKEFAALLEGVTDPSLKALLMTAAPSRMHVGTFEIDLGVTLAKETEAGFAIRALPIGLGFSILHRTRTDRTSRLKVTVQQTPFMHEDLRT